MLSQLHAAHPGVLRMKRLLQAYMWWSGLDEQLEGIVRVRCVIDNKRHACPILFNWWPSQPWADVDLAGPFVGRVFLVLMDAHTKWMEVSILSSATSESTINHLREIFAIWSTRGISYWQWLQFLKRRVSDLPEVECHLPQDIGSISPGF